jgi:hypothetical protein
VKVWCTLYRQGRSGAVVPLELRADMVAGQFTPRAARQAPWAVAHLTPTGGGWTVRMARAGVKESDGEEDASDGGGGRAPTTPAVAAGQLADGAKDNWTFLSDELPTGEEIIDFYHAAEHLKAAFAVARRAHLVALPCALAPRV